MGSACHVSVGGMLGCSSPRRSSPYTACCLSFSTPKHRGRLLGLLLGILLDLRGNQIDPCAAITHSKARSRAPCSTGPGPAGRTSGSLRTLKRSIPCRNLGP